jgi:hypothetical protein
MAPFVFRTRSRTAHTPLCVSLQTGGASINITGEMAYGNGGFMGKLMTPHPSDIRMEGSIRDLPLGRALPYQRPLRACRLGHGVHRRGTPWTRTTPKNRR